MCEKTVTPNISSMIAARQPPCTIPGGPSISLENSTKPMTSQRMNGHSQCCRVKRDEEVPTASLLSAFQKNLVRTRASSPMYRLPTTRSSVTSTHKESTSSNSDHAYSLV
jgi:hypothetical protein